MISNEDTVGVRRIATRKNRECGLVMDRHICTVPGLCNDRLMSGREVPTRGMRLGT
jgi:hypothetical protein